MLYGEACSPETYVVVKTKKRRKEHIHVVKYAGLRNLRDFMLPDE